MRFFCLCHTFLMALPITPPSCFIIQPKRHRVLPPYVPFSLRPLFISSISQMAVVLKICVFFLGVVTESLDVALLNRSRRIRINERTYTHTRTHTWRWMYTHTHVQREHLYRTTYGARATFVFKFQCL